MKKLILLSLCLSLYVMTQAQVSQTAHVTSGGRLSTAIKTVGGDLATVTNLTITGTLTAPDFKAMRDSMPLLAVLDMSAATIAAYTGTDGTAGVTSIAYPANEVPAYSCLSPITYQPKATLVTIQFPKSATSIGDWAFYNCNLTGTLVIPDWVTSIGIRAFGCCYNLTGLTLGNSVINIGSEAFWSCYRLAGTLTIPNSVTTIGSAAFSGCDGFTGNLNIGSLVASIDIGAFESCSGITDFTVAENNPNFSGKDGVLFNKDRSLLKQCPAGKQGTCLIPESVKSIDSYAFSDCRQLTGSLTIPGSVTSIGGFAFEGCSGFSGNLVLPNSITTIQFCTFQECSGLTNIIIPNTVTSIGNAAFAYCTGLTKICINNQTPPTICENTFYSIDNTKCELIVPVGATSAYVANTFWNGFTLKAEADLSVPPSALSYNQSPVTAILNETEISASPSVTGYVSRYSIDPALPAGLSLNTTTGIISGTPTEQMATQVYKVTATNSIGSTDCNFTLTVSEVSPSGLSYVPNSIASVQNTTDISAIPTITTGQNLTYKISPALPNGLSIDGVTGKISGTPTVLSAWTQYTVTASNTAGSTDCTFTLAVSEMIPTVEIWKNETLQGSCGSLKKAFDYINDGTYTGDLELKLIANTLETSSAVLNASGTGNASYSSVNIYPVATGLSISGNLEAPLIDLNGATHVTINGSLNGGNTGKDLTIVNTSASATEGTSTIRFINDASSDTVTNCTIKGSSLDTGAGVLFFGETTGTTGNSHIIIENNDITNAADANRPVNAIYSWGAKSTENSGNEIRHNNIYDFINRELDSNGISLDGNSNSWTITGNSLYETTALAPTGDANNNSFGSVAINIYSNSINSFMVSDNFIGGNAAECAGVMSVSSTANYKFKGISLDVRNTTASLVQNNTIKNINYTSNDSDNGFEGIESSGNVHITGNIIGAAEGTGSITLNSGNDALGLTFIGIYADGDGNVENNILGSINLMPADEATSVTFVGIISAGKSVSNNLIGSKMTANSISLAAAYFIEFGIFGQGYDNMLLSGNTIANMTNETSNATAESKGTISGIFCETGANTITNNTIRNLSGSNTIKVESDFAFPSTGGIVQASEDPGQIISGNKISGLSNTNPAFKGYIAGLSYSGGTDGSNQVSGNFIQNLSVHPNSTDANIYGIKIDAGAAMYANNIISLTGNTASYVYGIYDNGQADKLYFNTVQIGGTLAAGTTNNSYALFSTYKPSPIYSSAVNAQKIKSAFANLLTSKLSKFQQARKQSMQLVKSTVAADNTRDFKNNIFSNTRSTEGGAGLHYAIGINDAGNTTLTLDDNDYLATGTGSILGNYNGVDQPVLPIVTANDGRSITINPTFKNSTGANAKDYFPLSTSLAGVPLTDVTTDFEGITRSVTVPTMGAIEYIESLPTITTQDVSGIGHDVATGNGTITDLGVPYPTVYGVCWNTTGAPTILDSKVGKGTVLDSGTFTVSMIGLSAGTTYYVRAFATNSVDTVYGEEVTFKTSGAAGIDDPMTQQITVYPNPVTDAFQLRGLNGGTSISLVDVSGRTVLQKQVVENEAVSVSTLLKGVYVLKIKTHEGTTEWKVIKK
ncbi:MAG: leucine-rich repeat protein [Bacteroidota bacterium]|nr:leucine-rich repeat protein [Bacteroidota bacterium]